MDPFKTSLAGLTALAFATVALSGCVMGNASGSVGIYVKDDVTDHYSEVHVTYSSVQVLPEDADAWVTAFEGQQTIELLSLNASTAKEKLADLSLEPGAYEGLRIGISAVEAVDQNGTSHDLIVVGDYLELAEGFEVDEDGDLSLLVDFDLDRSIDPEAGTFEAEAANVQRSDEDADGDGIPDIDDADDDGDGIEDADDDDIDGDNRTDRPEQSRHGYFGLCTAWFASEAGRGHGDAQNSTAFQRLRNESAAQNQTVEAFCDAQAFPGQPEHVPDHARQAREAAMERRAERGPPEERGPEGNLARGPSDERGVLGDEARRAPKDVRAAATQI